MLRRTWSKVAFIAFAGISCRHAAGTAPPGACPQYVDEQVAGAAVLRGDGRPTWVLVPRDGDPQAAVGVVVVTGGTSYASTALSAVLEARLQKAGFGTVDARADRDSFRLRTLVDTPERAVEFERAVQKALAAPVAPGSPELGIVARRVAALRRHPLEGPVAAAVARCTGELGLLASEPAPEPTSVEGAAAVEAARAASYGAQRVAFGLVGSAALADAVADAWKSVETWPKGSAVEGTGAGEDDVGAFVAAGRAGSPARLTVAVAHRDAEHALESALRAGAAEGALVARLRSLAIPFRVVDATGTARPRGGCASVSLEALRAGPLGAIEEGAAIAAAIARQELQGAVGSSGDASSDRNLGPQGSRAVRAASDPRDAAERAALWSLSQSASNDAERAAVALALAAPAESREAEGFASQVQASSKKFSSAFERLEKAWATPLLEHRERVERGQGELWLLFASPCGVLAEGETDAGMTALALMTALSTRSRESHGVTLEPWIAADGVGVLAHGARLPGESTTDHAERVAEEAARALAVFPFAAPHLANARAALLGKMGDGISLDGKAMNAAAAALVPGHPAWLAPLGSWDGLAKAGVEAASLRWSALYGGPLRAAVLANESQEQADAATRAADRWLVRSPQPRACSPVEPLPSPKAGTVAVVLASAPPLAQALVGLPMPKQGDKDAVFGELLLAGLGGTDGWLAKAMSSPSLAATAQARLVGGARAAALVVDVRTSEASLDAAVAQVRGLLERLRQGAMGASDFERSVAQRDRWDLEASLDPHRRIVDLWRDPRPAKPSAPPSLDAWRAWAAGALRDDKLVVVLARPRH